MCLDSNSNCLFAKIFFLMKNQALSNCRTEVCKALEMDEEQCELSMGMSGDFELAVWNSLLMLFNINIIILIVAFHVCICDYLTILVAF